jgi:hypothetical protein
MKSKLYLFLIMFLIWCLFNGCTMLVLDKLRYMDFNTSYIPVYFVTALVFSACAAIFQEDFKFTLVLILAAELCWLIILWIQGNENGAGYEHITFFNCSFFALVAYLVKVGAYWLGYAAGQLDLSNGLGMLLCELIFLGLSLIIVLLLRKLSIWLTERWTGEELSHPGGGYLS